MYFFTDLTMSIIKRWANIVEQSNGYLPLELKPFQLDTQMLLEEGRNVLVSVPTGAGKSLIQLNSSRIMGGKNLLITV